MLQARPEDAETFNSVSAPSPFVLRVLRVKSLEPLQVDRPVSGLDAQRRAAGAELAPHAGSADRARHGDGEIQRDVAVAGVGVQLRAQVVRQAQLDAPVAAAQRPRPADLRAALDLG